MEVEELAWAWQSQGSERLQKLRSSHQASEITLLSLTVPHQIQSPVLILPKAINIIYTIQNKKEMRCVEVRTYEN